MAFTQVEQVFGMSLRDIVLAGLRLYGTQTALAEAMHVDRSRVSTFLTGDPRYISFETTTCLRLAKAVGISPAVVLEAAGKSDVSQLLIALYGEPKPIAPPVVEPATVTTQLTKAELTLIERRRAKTRRRQERWGLTPTAQPEAISQDVEDAFGNPIQKARDVDWNRNPTPPPSLRRDDRDVRRPLRPLGQNGRGLGAGAPTTGRTSDAATDGTEG